MWPFRSRIPVDERILVWIRGRKMSWDANIAQGLNIGSGTLYPALQRLEKARKIESRWESDEPLETGKPRRRLYVAAEDWRLIAHLMP